MFRSTSLFAAVVLFQTVFAIDVSNSENQEFIYEGIIPIVALQDLMPGYTHPNGFIGDLEIGRRWENDTAAHILRFTGENWTSTLQTFNIPSFVFSDNKIVHYAGVVNAEDSYGAVCGNKDELGSNRSPNFTVRAASNTTVKLMITVFTHIID